MRVALVSSYPPMHCGIGVYTRNLAEALVNETSDISVTVVAERGAGAFEKERLCCRPCYGRSGEYGVDILEGALEARADLVHFQHAPDLFGVDGRLPDLLEKLKAEGVKTAVTLHTVNESGGFRKALGLRSAENLHRAIGGGADLLIVHHEKTMKERLLRQGLDGEKIRVIPHGTTILPPLDTRECRRELELPEEALIFTFFGFIHVQKNVHTVVEAFMRIAEDRPDARLFITGMPWDKRFYNRLYCRLIQLRIRMKGMDDRVVFRVGFVPWEMASKVFAASDVLLLPHWQKYGSASGVFHRAIGAGKALLYAEGPKFEEVGDALADIPEIALPASNISAWAEAMRAMAEDGDLRKCAGEAALEYAEETAWPKVALMHNAAYRDLIRF